MKRTRIAFALLAGTALAAGDLDAQVSKNSGFLLNLHLAGNSVTWDFPNTENETATGGGLGLGLGYGFGEQFALVVNLDGATVKFNNDADDGRASVHFDIGGRVNFGSTASAVRPYVAAAISGLAEGEGEGDEAVIVSGGGYSAAGGLQYFFSPRFALDAALQGTLGTFRQIQEGGETIEINGDASFRTARLQLGVTWHP